MLRNPLILLLLLIAESVIGQADTTIYYNNNWLPSQPQFANWYRKVHFINSEMDIAVATDYYSEGNVKRSRGIYIKDLTGLYPNGRFVNFYKDGKTESSGQYDYDYTKKIKGARIGKWMEFYENATLKNELNYDGIIDDTYGEQVINSWDSSGKQTITDGNGYRIYEENYNGIPMIELTFNCEYKKGVPDGKLVGNFKGTGKLYCNEEYRQGKLVEGTSYDGLGNKYTYNVVEQNPIFKGGDAELMRFLQKNIRYPTYEQSNYIMGKVLLRFVVDPSGNVTDVQVVRSVSGGLDREAVRVVNKLPPFSPGKRRGQPTSVFFNLPVVYRLQ